MSSRIQSQSQSHSHPILDSAAETFNVKTSFDVNTIGEKIQKVLDIQKQMTSFWAQPA